MSLQDWARFGWLIEHRTSPQEIAGLLALSDRDLVDCDSPDLSADWRLNIAYNAALQAATAALAASGYRASREMHHYRVVQSLAFTVQSDAAVIDRLDQFRKKRHLAAYERAGLTSDLEADEMVTLAAELRQSVETWLRANRPDLLVQS